MTSNITLLVFSQNNTVPLTFKVGKSTVYKARAGERYRLVRSEDTDASPVPGVVVRRVGQDLHLNDAENNQLILENYFAVCKDSSCELVLGSEGTQGLVFTDTSAPLAVLSDGSDLLYAEQPSSRGFISRLQEAFDSIRSFKLPTPEAPQVLTGPDAAPGEA